MTRTPFGAPVDPEVYVVQRRSEDLGQRCSMDAKMQPGGATVGGAGTDGGAGKDGEKPGW